VIPPTPPICVLLYNLKVKKTKTKQVDRVALLAFHCCDKMPERNNLNKGGKVCFGSIDVGLR
jgi:hypothetical protein